MRKLIITPDKLSKESDNINGPTVIKVPKWIKNPLAKYYMYFAHHKGTHIKLAFANNIFGPWTVFQKGVLSLNEIQGRDHLASPDIYFSNEKIFMIYHSVYKKSVQLSSTAVSNDGLNFIPKTERFASFYFRRFVFKSEIYGFSKSENDYGCIYKLVNNKFQIINNKFIYNLRHGSIIIENNKVYCYFTRIGDSPEKVLVCNINMDTFNPSIFSTVIEPKYNWEGVNNKLEPSKFGMAKTKLNQLRDPFVFKENNLKYLFYSVQGEYGIAVTEIK